MSDLLVLDGVHTYIGEFHILQGVSFAVPAGNVTALLGRNGAGKTTTLRTVMGLFRPRRGRVELGGAAIGGRPPYDIAHLGVGYVPEDRGVFIDLTVEENLRLALRTKSDSVERKKAFLFDLFPDLERFWKTKGGALSGGQQQMLAIARALVPENRLLLIDEPTKGLAPIIIEHLQEVLGRLKGQVTVLLVEQNLVFARALADHCVLLDDGCSVWAGPVDGLSAELEHKYLGVAAHA